MGGMPYFGACSSLLASGRFRFQRIGAVVALKALECARPLATGRQRQSLPPQLGQVGRSAWPM
jgi:hypothetical protein